MHETKDSFTSLCYQTILIRRKELDYCFKDCKYQVLLEFRVRITEGLFN